jgi:putative phosphoesterase
MTRIAVIADIHGNILALKSVVADIASIGVDAVINLGDHLSGPLWPRETAEYLTAQAWLHITGNHDRELGFGDPAQYGPSDAFAYRQIEPLQREWLAALPKTYHYDDNAGAIFCFHGTPTSDTEFLLEHLYGDRLSLRPLNQIEQILGKQTAEVLLCGHSHVPRCVRLSSGSIVVNPGSVGLPAFEEGEGTARYRVENGAPHAKYAILEHIAGSWNVSLRTVAYDWDQAVRKAEAEGRTDWAIALATGFSRM